MEANIKENQLTFSKGMSNVPSDNLCEDNTLSDCVGLRMKDGELRAVQEAKSYGVLDGELYYVHKAATYRHLIYRKDDLLYWAESDENGIKNIDNKIGEDNEQLSSVGVRKITSIGNTLIISTEAGMKYAVWRGGEYKVVNGLPEVSVSLKPFGGGMGFLPEGYTDVEENKAMELLNHANNAQQTPEEAKASKDEIIGIIEGAYKKALSGGFFTFPFWARVALKLYDGSYAMISNPVLVFPTIRSGAFVHVLYKNQEPYLIDANYSSFIQCKIEVDGSFEGLEEIVDSVALFLSDQVKTWEEKGDGEPYYIGGDEEALVWDIIDSNCNYISLKSKEGQSNSPGHYGRIDVENSADASLVDCYYMPPVKRFEDDVIDDLINKSVFYKVAELKTNSPSLGVYKGIAELAKDHVLENLTTQEQLPHDDYFGHCQIKANFVYSFNNRLQIANINRKPYEGCYHFTSRENNNTMTAKVRISGRDGYMYVQTAINSYNNETPVFFYYPDPNADYVYFSNGTYKKLTPHPRLNGAYYFDKLPPNTVTGDDSIKMEGGVDSEHLSTIVLTSEVNNPWVFNAEGDNTVGTGEIIGIVSNTRALSQGQFGQYPLIVFTTEGIYALGTNSEGLYSTNTPLSREVCNNADSITPTDGAVFFTSEKGLMMMVGSDITCVSQQMMGKTDNYSPDSLYDNYSREDTSFYDFLKKCKIAYDYRDYCLYIYNDNFPSYCYVYDIKSGAITRKAETGVIIDSIVNDYPDNLLQDSDGVVWSLLNKSNMNYDTNAYDGILLSRPVKFGDAQTLKSVRQIKHVMDINDKATLELHIYVSNDLKHWGEVKSLRGSGWKYFRFGLKFSNLKATDSYSGMICITQNRRTDKLR